jgi:hypothetical protein
VAVSLAALIAVTMGQFYALIPRVTLPAVGCPTGGAAALRRPFSTDNDAMVAVSSFPKLTISSSLFSLLFSRSWLDLCVLYQMEQLPPTDLYLERS